MSIFKTLGHIKHFSISCDSCDETFVETHGLINPVWEEDGVSSFSDKEDAEGYARRNGWVKVGDKHYCPDCFVKELKVTSATINKEKGQAEFTIQTNLK